MRKDRVHSSHLGSAATAGPGYSNVVRAIHQQFGPHFVVLGRRVQVDADPDAYNRSKAPAMATDPRGGWESTSAVAADEVELERGLRDGRMVGWVPGSCDVLIADLDTKALQPEEVPEAAQFLRSRFPPLAEYPSGRGDGSRHFLYRADAALDGNWAFRGRVGGQLIHSARYAVMWNPVGVLEGLRAAAAGADPTDLSSILIDPRTGEPTGKRAPVGERAGFPDAVAVAGAPIGTRHETLFRAAKDVCVRHGAGPDRDAELEAVRAAAAKAGLSEKDAAHAIRQAAKTQHAREADARRAAAAAERLPARLWSAGCSPEGTPGGRYVRRRAFWPASAPLPPSVRWLPADTACREVVAPTLPHHAAGIVLYRFDGDRDPADADARALQIEAFEESHPHGRPVTDYRRLLFAGGGKRPACAGSDLDGGRRTFRAHDVDGDPEAVVLVEGPIAALAFAALFAAGRFRLPPRTSIRGCAGAGFFAPAVFPVRCGLRVLAADVVASRACFRAFKRRRLPVRILPPEAPGCPRGAAVEDWTAAAAELHGAARPCSVCAGPLPEGPGCPLCATFGDPEEHPADGVGA